MATANHVLLRRTTLTASASSVTLDFTGVSGYTDLKILISGRDSSSAGTSGNGYSFTIYPNGLSTNIVQRSIYSGSPVGVGGYSDTQMYNVAEMNADTANTYSNIEVYVSKYSSSDNKHFIINGVTENNGASAATRISGGLWSSSSAITSLQFNAYSTWMAGSSFAVYGIANAATTPVSAPKADGGDIIKTDGTYWYHTFLSSGIFRPQVNLTCDYLVVAGGGSGGNNNGGGGGAGGYRSGSAFSVTSAVTVTVGAGGASTVGSSSGGKGNSGTDSTFSTISATGGGWGGGYPSYLTNGGSGGSGGGSGNTGSGIGGTGNAGGYSPVEGYAGGASNNGAAGSGGGGGGSSAAGSINTTNAGGAGGNGTANSISGTSVTYAGGGGGGTGTGTAGAGGTGGGGAGGVVNGVAGTANTGGGGGGSGGNSSSNSSGSGGSGVVIIRYPV